MGGHERPSPDSFDGNLSVISSGSMVQIDHVDGDSSPGGPSAATLDEEDAKYQLVYSKSKVYVNPTAYSRDNIPGFVAVVKRDAATPTYFLAWIPESLLKSSNELDKWVKIEERVMFDDDDEDAVLVDLPLRPESYAFSIPLSSVYSLVVYPPSLSSWHGSIAINLISGSTLPTLYFHDDESRSFTAPQSPKTDKRSTLTSYPPPPTIPTKPMTTWGGEDLIARLRSYAHLLRSTLQPSLFLVDPSRADVEAHSTQVFDDDAVDDILAQSSYANSHSPIPTHRRPRPLSSQPVPPPNPYSHRSSVLHRSLPGAGASPSTSQNSSQARMALLQSFSNITRATRHAAQSVLSHPLAKPIVPHLPDPVRSLINADGEWDWGSWVEKGGVGEFESARVYLARWARVVAEEGERARRKEAQAIPSTGSVDAEETSSLGVFELLQSARNLPEPKSSRDPLHPVDEAMWSSWFGKDAKPSVSVEFMKQEVFKRGVKAQGGLRKTVWPYVLGVLPWNMTTSEREVHWAEKKRQYHESKDIWCGVAEVFDRPDTVEERHRIDVDCRRTDRSQPLFQTPSSTPAGTVNGSSRQRAMSDDEKAQHIRYSTISPQTADIGAQSPSNDHIDRLASILLTYNFYEKELGYVQGMSDLCAPIYVIMDGEEEMTFWCFVEVMNRMKQNFLRDQSGMKKQLLTLQELISVMDPELYRHLEKTDGLNLFFCFRWVLIAFKREFPFNDVLRLWEVLWTDHYSNNFVLFVALAVLESHRDVILRYLVEFDEILKYCNELSMTIELDTTLAQAEVLFLSFSQLVADLDRRRAEQQSGNSHTGLRRRGGASSSSAPTETATVELPELSSNLRDLLITGRS